MKLTIETSMNGYIMYWIEETEEGVFKEQRRVVEENETEDQKECMTRLLHQISDHFGILSDRYGTENLNIKWDKKGHKI